MTSLVASANAEPVARGDLAETPFCHLAIYLRRREMSGTLVITSEDATEAGIRFAGGRLNAARLDSPATTLLQGLLPLCGRAQGPYVFFDADLLRDTSALITGNVDPYSLLIASLRDHVRDEVVNALLSRFAGVRLRLHPYCDLGRLKLATEDQSLIALLRETPCTPEELVSRALLPQERSTRLLYGLIATHTLEPHEEPEAIAIPVEAPLPAWRMLAGLKPSAAPPAASIPAPIKSAPSPPLSPDTKKEDPTIVLRRVEQALQRGRPDEALIDLDRLLAAEPERGDLLALRAQALFERHRVESDDGLPKFVLEALKKALEVDPYQPRALFTRGLILQRAGDTKKALVCFKKVLQVDPKHLEAQREVRLAKLRGEG